MMNKPEYNESSIQQMTQLEHIRSKYSMYIGAADLDADCQLLKEITDNAFDEILTDAISTIKVIFFTKGDRYQVAVVDHGRGIPCSKLKQIYTEAYTSGKYSAQAYNAISIGSYGIGSKCVSALSARFTAFSKRLDGFAGLSVERGIVSAFESGKPIDKNANTVGTTVIYEVDRTILKESAKYMTDERGLQRTLKYFEYVCAFKSNAKVEVYRVDDLLSEDWFKQSFKDMWLDIQSRTGELIYKTPDSISPFEYAKAQNNVTSPTVWKLSLRYDIDPTNPRDTTGYFLEVGVVKDCEKQYGLLATVNSNPIGNYTSSHISVLMDRVKKHLHQYIDDDDKDLQVFFDVRYDLPIHGYVCAFYKNASYINQTKDGFKDADFARIYGQLLDKQLSKEPDKTWEDLFDLIVDDLNDKFAAANSRAFQTGKSLKNAAFKITRIGSFIPCAVNNQNETELLVTEGSSAGGFAKQVRNENFQAILQLRGKPINAIKVTTDRLRTDDVYRDLMQLCGVGPRDTDLKNFNFRSIGLLADADPDGYHIICLLIGLLYRINPLIVESGRVWIANPPLYVTETKDVRYMRDQKALDDARVAVYEEYFQLSLLNTLTGKSVELSGPAFRDFVYLVKRIGATIRDVATKLVIDPCILEQLTHVVDYLSKASLDCEKIKDYLQLERCQYEPIANVLLMVSEGSEIAIPMDRLVHEIRSYIEPEVEPIHWGVIQPLLTTKTTNTYDHEPMAFMEIDKIFSDLDDAYKVRRLKGLSEFSLEQLKYTCVDPATRSSTIVRSIGDVDKLYNLMGVDPKWRKELAKTPTGKLIGDYL